jgi:hypothetical protein
VRILSLILCLLVTSEAFGQFRRSAAPTCTGPNCPGNQQFVPTYYPPQYQQYQFAPVQPVQTQQSCPGGCQPGVGNNCGDYRCPANGGFGGCPCSQQQPRRSEDALHWIM